jgi:sugar O-acyltransferase (sialic acid O-acetyltransferase NeuD family)
MTKHPIVVFGNGQMAEIAHTYLTYDSDYEVVAFCVDGDYLEEDAFRGLPVVSFESVVEKFPPDKFGMFLPISAKEANQLRARKYAEAKEKGYTLISYVSPKATVYPDVQIGENCFIFENNVIQPFARIGNNCILWSGNHIGHHSTIEDHCFLASHVVISGRVTVEPACYFGVNATVRDGIRIGESTVVGAGALILKNTKPRSVYVQVPTTRAPFSSESANLV